MEGPPLKEEFKVTHDVKETRGIKKVCDTLSNLLTQQFLRIGPSSRMHVKFDITLSELRPHSTDFDL